MVKVEQVKIGQCAGLHVIGDVVAQDLHRLIEVAQSHEEVCLLLHVEQFFHIHDAWHARQAGQTG